ncbi:GIN domain-containing protein [Methanobacterium alcaliphilum]|uniref:GIN domain-containing protein n=1 Tax=Methanobacterium alcaliphilum TaxID=392018 RepID=UPI002009E452|nr:DUF2807 domain-containing protein [Methanobacterium alcaliphilum]MCK9150410.1 DUF2807 domain-containing protein [Methanobacterium alcaliphilum]
MGKMSYVVMVGFVLCLVVAASGCTQDNGTGNQTSGKVNTTKDVSGVTNVILTGPGTLIIQQGDNDSLVIEAESDIMSKITTTVAGNSLAISNYNAISNRAVKFYLTLKNMDTITGTGGGEIQASKLNTNKLIVTVDTGKITLEGKSRNLLATINGGGSILAGDMPTQTATVTINGEGNAELNVVKTLNAIVNGGGSIIYQGSPKVTQQVNGEGSVKKSS